MEPKLLKFRYVNWKGNEHEYVIKPEILSLQFTRLQSDEEIWTISGTVVTRDGDPRTIDMMGNRRRTFNITGLKDVVETDGKE